MSKTKKRLIITFSIIGVFVVLLIVFGVFFRVTKIYVDFGSSKLQNEYSVEEVIETSKIKKGNNIMFLNKYKAIDRLEEKFAYGKFSIVRKFPNIVTIKVKERTPVFRVKVNGIWHIYDEDLKCLEIAEETTLKQTGKDKITTLNGVELEWARDAGEKIDDKNFGKKLTAIIDGVYGAGETEIDIMSDITHTYNATLGFDEWTFTIAETGTKLIVQGETNFVDKIAFGVGLYLGPSISQNGEYAGKLDKVVITVFNSFDLENGLAQINVTIEDDKP